MRYADRVAGISWETIEEVRGASRKGPPSTSSPGSSFPRKAGRPSPP